MIEVGRLVMSLKGHDAGRIYLTVGTDEKSVCLSDGKEHRLSEPKRKNVKHVYPILDDVRIDVSQMTDGVLRRLLKEKGKVYDSIIN